MIAPLITANILKQKNTSVMRLFQKPCLAVNVFIVFRNHCLQKSIVLITPAHHSEACRLSSLTGTDTISGITAENLKLIFFSLMWENYNRD